VTAKITIRLNRELLESLRKAAEKEKRSVNQQVLFYVQKGLEKQEKEKGANQK